MKLASIEKVIAVENHPDADRLDIATVKGYKCIVGRDSVRIGQNVVLIQPDTVLPNELHFEMFNKRSNRVRAQKLRGVWSFGIVMPFESFPDSILDKIFNLEVGSDISTILGVSKYEAPVPQCMDARGNLPLGLPKTDEERWQNLVNEMRLGETVDVTLKVDGQSASYYCFKDQSSGEWRTGVTSRSLDIKLDASNNYTTMESRYDILNKLKAYCEIYDVSLAIRGEIYGSGIQSFGKNPHAKQPKNIAMFSVWNHDKHCYESPVSQHNVNKLCTVFGIPTVPTIEEAVPLTKELIEKYSTGIKTIDEKPFEGVVIKYHSNGDSFKVINLDYDTRK
jgi:RNA ligase (TIGR02306 family)